MLDKVYILVFEYVIIRNLIFNEVGWKLLGVVWIIKSFLIKLFINNLYLFIE